MWGAEPFEGASHWYVAREQAAQRFIHRVEQKIEEGLAVGP